MASPRAVTTAAGERLSRGCAPGAAAGFRPGGARGQGGRIEGGAGGDLKEPIVDVVRTPGDRLLFAAAGDEGALLG